MTDAERARPLSVKDDCRLFSTVYRGEELIAAFYAPHKHLAQQFADGESGLRTLIGELAAAANKLPLDSFGDDMGQHDAAEFVDHAGEFFEAMLALKPLLARAALIERSK